MNEDLYPWERKKAPMLEQLAARTVNNFSLLDAFALAYAVSGEMPDNVYVKARIAISAKLNSCEDYK